MKSESTLSTDGFWDGEKEAGGLLFPFMRQTSRF
jgi:hypothetical protein